MMRTPTSKIGLSFLISMVMGATVSATPGNGHNNGGGKTGNGQDTSADVYISHVAPYGIRGDEVMTDGDWSYYPVNSGGLSCAGASVTDQADGYVRMFVPAGTADGCVNGTNRFARLATDYDLDQDGLCVLPYTGRSDSGSFTRYYGCVGPEPDGFEEVMFTMHLPTVLGPTLETGVAFQIRLLEYGDDYAPDPGYDPIPADLTFVGSQERAFNISLSDPSTSLPDPDDPEVRIFENTTGTATICQVVWKNAHAHDCYDLVDSYGDPIVITGLTMKGKVDPTPVP